MEVPISDIVITGWNPRKSFDEKALEELAASIKEHGILEPLVVRQVNGSYELVAGERRLRAAKLAGLDKVPVVVKDLTDQEVKEIMLLENLQRQDLNPIEEAQALKALLEEGNITQAELGKKLGKSQAWIANRLRLLKAPKELQEMLISREISPKHVMVLLPFTEYAVFKKKILPQLKEKLKDGPVSVRALEEMIRNAVVGDWQHEFVLCLTDFPYEFQKYKEIFDSSGCEGCRHVFEFENWAGKQKYCLNRQCWKDRINRAKHRYEKDRKRNLGDGVVDTSELSFDEYEHLKFAQFDQSECESCGHKKKDTDGDSVCLNPECFRKKTDAWRRELIKLKREKEKKALEVLNDYIAAFCSDELEHVYIPAKALRAIFGYFESTISADDFKKAMEPWKDRDITDQELYFAILRLIVVHSLYELNVESVERLFKRWEEKYRKEVVTCQP